MKIVHVIFSMNTGGAELMLVDIMNRQVRRGHDVHLLIINNQYTPSIIESVDPKVKVHYIGRPEGSRNPWWILKYNLKLRYLKADVIHFHHDGAVGMVPVLPRHAVNVGTIHAPGIAIKHYKHLDRVFAISNGVRNDTLKRTGVDSTVVYNGINTDDIVPADSQSLPGQSFKIIQVGRVSIDVKGQDILIRAIARLTGQGYDITVDFIGAPFDRPVLDELAKELGIHDRVNYLGLRDRRYIYSHLKDYNLLAVPSRYEGFGLTLAEAMAAKIPVLASDTEGPAELLADNTYGELFKNEDVDDCARALKQIIDNYPKYMAIARDKAYHYAIDNFSIASTVANYINQYQELIERNKK